MRVFHSPGSRRIAWVLQTATEHDTHPEFSHLDTDESVTPDTHYVENGALVPIPERPSTLHRFDFEACEWVAPVVTDEQRLRDMKAEAIQGLRDSEWITARSYEYGEPVPEKWRIYREKLRNIVRLTEYQEVQIPQPPT